MVVLDIPFIYHPEHEGEARGQGRYMNGVSRTTMVYLFILTVYRIDASFSESRGQATMVLHVRDLATAAPNWTNCSTSGPD